MNIVRMGLLLSLAICVGGVSVAQTGYVNPWAIKDVGTLPPVASLTDGVWLKGDLHVHSRHSKESSNHPIAKITGFAKSVGIDYLCITDHDNHVNGDVAHNTWADPEFKSSPVLLL